MDKLKEKIPHILSASRIVLSPIIIYCGLKNFSILTSLLIVFGVGTDYLDGKLARKWNVKNKCKFSVDAVGDKVFIASSALALIFSNPMALIPIPLELAIGTTNIISHVKGYKPKTNKYGQLKQALLYLTYFFYSLTLIFPIFKYISLVFSGLTCVAQVLALKRYISKYKEAKQNSLESNDFDVKLDESYNEAKEKTLENTRDNKLEELRQMRKNLVTNNDIVSYQKKKKFGRKK